MTKEELKQESEKSLNKRLGTYAYIRKQDCYTNYVDGYIDSAEPREKRIADLEAQIEKMKCCGNCENGELSAHEEPCRHCQRCFVSKDVTDQENVKDNWEEIKEVKEK